MTRLKPEDVGSLIERLEDFETSLREITGLGLRGVAMRSVAHAPCACHSSALAWPSFRSRPARG